MKQANKRKEPFVVKTISDKGDFLEEIVVIKLGSDSVVTDDGLNIEYMKDVAQQVYVLTQNGIRVILVTSGGIKLGRSEAVRAGEQRILTRSEYSELGFQALMEAWQIILEEVGLLVILLAITGQDLTQKSMQRIRTQIGQAPSQVVHVVNTQDHLNHSRFKYWQEAANNDVVGERFAKLCRATHFIIGTNVDGVLDEQKQPIRQITTNEQLNGIHFFQEANTNGTGGMKTKLDAAVGFAKTGGTAHIVKGDERNGILRAFRGEAVGTTVKLKESSYEK